MTTQQSTGEGDRLIQVTKLPRLPQRKSDSHKGDYGRVLVIGGSRGMVGAPALAAHAALRSGAGLVTVACPASIQQSVAVLCSCATTIPLPETTDGRIDPAKALATIDASGAFGDTGTAKPSAVAAGPGVGRGDAEFDEAWRSLLRVFAVERDVPVVIDADGLNALPFVEGLPPSKRGAGRGMAGGTPMGSSQASEGTRSTAIPWKNLVLTPHPGEMARLCQTSVTDVQSRREQIAVALSRAGGSDANTVTVLKGAGTIVTDGQRMYVNRTGNPGMATGGTGDLLTGMIAALIGQGLSRFDAAVLGVYVHGRAGDMTARAVTQISMTAADMAERLSQAFASLSRD